MSVEIKPVSLAERLQKLRRRFVEGTVNRKIFGAALTIASMSGMVKIAAVLKALVIAWMFGARGSLDVYFVAIHLPTLAASLLAGSFGGALMPTLVRVRERGEHAAAQRLFSSATFGGLCAMCLVAILIAACAPFYLPWLASGFPPQKLKLTALLIAVIAPTIVLSGLSGLWGAVLNAGERFALAALAPALTPLISVAFMLAGGKRWGVLVLAFGSLCGAVIEATVLARALKRQGWDLTPRWCGMDANVREMGGQLVPRIAASFVRSGANLADRAMAASLLAGSVSALAIGERLNVTLFGVISLTLSTAAAPYFAQMAARKDWDGVLRTLRYYLGLIFAFTLPLAIFLYLESPQIVRFLYQRGSFSAHDTEVVAQIQAFVALQIPFTVANTFMNRWLTSVLASHLSLWSAVLNTLCNISLNLMFIREMGVAGIALATSCSGALTFVFLSFCVWRVWRQRAAKFRLDESLLLGNESTVEI